MIKVESKIRKWGRSFGLVVPINVIRKNNIKENEEVEIFISKKENPLKKLFGSVKFKKSVNEILSEGDKEGWDE